MENETPSIIVATSELRERLNSYYSTLRSSGKVDFKARHFYDLWDLKELALLQERETVCVPAPWFDEINGAMQSMPDTKKAS